MLIKVIILSTMLNNDPIIIAMPPAHKIEASRKRGKSRGDRRRGGGGLR